MINELDRLLTITDLSEMLGVPVDTLYGWRHRGEGPEGYRIGRHVRYRRAAVEAWLDTQADRRRGRTLSGVAFNSATPPDEPVRSCTTKCVTVTRRVSITARPKPDWSMPSAGRLRLKSRLLPQPGEILGAVSCILPNGRRLGCPPDLIFGLPLGHASKRQCRSRSFPTSARRRSTRSPTRSSGSGCQPF